MKVRQFVRSRLNGRRVDDSSGYSTLGNTEWAGEQVLARNRIPAPATHLPLKGLSPWSRSNAKRIFDCACVLLALPLLIPIFLLIALAVRLTSSGPVLFLQERMGRSGRTFTIFKFRTLIHSAEIEHHAVTTAANQRFTPVGPFLRRWKLDELPQLLNVLLGDMSLVGPRPKMPEHLVSVIPCRPGITGAATVAFAREERALAHLAKEQLDDCYHTVILPAKHSLDAQYMARATFLSDLNLIVNSVLRRWDESILDSLPIAMEFQAKDETRRSGANIPVGNSAYVPMPSNHVEQPAAFE